MTQCQVASNQPPASAVPGNIGKVRSQVYIWDHDPFLARPYQHLAFPFSQDAANQMQANPTNIQFGLGTAYLKPSFITHDMFVATRRKDFKDGDVEGLDIVGSTKSGVAQEIKEKLPGGHVYENSTRIVNDPASGDPTVTDPLPRVGKDIFQHQLWLYVGNILKRGVPIHPSEYIKDIAEQEVAKNIAEARNLGRKPDEEEYFDKWTFGEIQSAPKWDYTQIEDNGIEAVWPVMVSKQVPDVATPVHWSLEKFTPLWQGEDFFVTIRLGDKAPDDAVDSNPGGDRVDTNWEDYTYLMYKLDFAPPTGWVDGISNEAYYVKKEAEEGSSEDLKKDPGREKFWWRYKTYILIEVGASHPQHNYFIEIVKGRHPRLIHIGEEWDHPDRLKEGADLDSTGFTMIRKSRELSVFPYVSSDELFRRKEFRVSVRNHLGRLVITFDGYEGTPWVVTRLDNDRAKYNFDKTIMPMIVPPGPMVIHGGNVSCAINFSPMQYVSSGMVPFYNRQADTGPPWSPAGNNDLYMTFSTLGTNVKWKRPVQEFNKIEFGGWDCDAYTTTEMIRNNPTDFKIYELADKQYKKYGKGYVLKHPEDLSGQAIRDPETGLLKPFAIQTALTTKHKLIIDNARNPGKKFTFGLTDDADSAYPYKESASRWDVAVVLQAGTVELPKYSDTTIKLPGADKKKFEHYVTPIATSWRMTVLGGGKPIADNIDEVLDISPLVTSIQDNWTAEGFTTLQHEMQMRCYIPIGVPTGTPGYFPGQQQDLYALGQKLLALHNKSFYLTVKYWWDDGVGERRAIGNRLSSLNPEDNDLLIQMTGVAYGAELERSVNKLFMSFTVKDYMSILQKQFIFNSPFFDAVADVVAIYDVAKMAGFDDTVEHESRINRQPLGYLQKVLKEFRRTHTGKIHYNGEENRTRPYDLPGSYADLANPAVKFQNGKTLDGAIKQIAQLAGKVVYFDRWGVLKYENIPAIEAAFNSSTNTQEFRSVFDFVTSPWEILETGESSTERFVFDANDPDHGTSHLVHNVVNYSRSVEDCINQIVLLTASRDIKLADGRTVGGFVVEGYTFFDQIWYPDQEGFFGFRKPFYQSSGVFGGIEGVREGLKHYAKMKYPPLQTSFQTYGVPGLKALDIISLDDYLFYITDISHEIDPSTNKWWMNITAEWLKPFLGDLGFLEDRGPQPPSEG